jgi:uncharacterized glyoxalase superfamily protein PhnB
LGIKLEQVNVVVRDMDAMAAFYETLGISLNGGTPDWAPHHRNSRATEGVDLDLDSTTFAKVWNEGWPGGTGVVLGFRVDDASDVDRLYAELTGAGHVGQQPPYDAFFGARYAVVTDPEGNAVGIMGPSDPALRRQQPPPA